MADETRTAIAWYRAEDWPTIKARAVDADKLHARHADWLANATDAERTLRKQGIECVRVIIEPDALELWCLLRGRKNDGDARSAYAMEMLLKQDAKPKAR